MRSLPLLAICLVAANCVVDEPPVDGRDDSFASGKTDSALTSAQARAVLALVNRATLAELDDDVPLDARAARNIVAHRDGADGRAGSADDDLFDDLAELDAVPWVGPVALRNLVDYADANPAAPERCLIISEYIEKWGNYNKAVELLNCGSAPIDLATVQICLVRNDDRSCSLTDDVGAAELPAGAVTTLCRRQTGHEASLDPVPALADLCDLERPGVMSFDGDDRLLLLDADDGTVLDALGRVGYRPPAETWSEIVLRRCNFTPADGVSYYDHTDYFTEVRGLELADFGVAPTPGC